MAEPAETDTPDVADNATPVYQTPPDESPAEARIAKLAKLAGGYDRDAEAALSEGERDAMSGRNDAQTETVVEEEADQTIVEPEVIEEAEIAAEDIVEPATEIEPAEPITEKIKVDGEEKELTLEQLKTEASKKMAADKVFRQAAEDKRAAAEQKKANDQLSKQLADQQRNLEQREAALAQQLSTAPLPSDAGPISQVDVAEITRRAVIDEDPEAIEQYNAIMRRQPTQSVTTTEPMPVPDLDVAQPVFDEQAIYQNAEQRALDAVRNQQWEADRLQANDEVMADEGNTECLALPGAMDAVNRAFNDLQTVNPNQSAGYYVKQSMALVRSDYETKIDRKFGQPPQPLPTAMEQRRIDAAKHASAVTSSTQSARAVGTPVIQERSTESTIASIKAGRAQ